MNSSIKMLGVVLLAVVLVAAVAGCAKKTPTAPPMIEPAPPMPGDEAGTGMPADAPAEAAAGEVGTLAEALKTVTPPDTVAMITTDDKGKEMTQLLSFKDGKLVKAAMVTDSGTLFVDFETKEALTYDLEQKMAFKIPLGEEGEEGADMPVLDASGLQQDAKIVATEDVGGAACWVMTSTMSGAEGEGKFWVDKKTGLLRKGEMQGDAIEFTFERINEVAASEFELPEGTEVMDMSDMSGGEDD